MVAGLAQGLPKAAAIDVPVPGSNKKSHKKKPDTQKTDDLTFITANLTGLIKTIFDVTAAAAGPHWSVSVGEAAAIAEPTARILDRLDLSSTAGKYGDYVALVIALTAVVVPRAMMQKSSKGGEDHAKPQSKVNQDRGGNDQPSPNNGQGDVRQLFSNFPE